MMTNLFEIFDPMSDDCLSLNWIVTLVFMFMSPYMYWLIPSRINFLWVSLVKLLYKELNLIIMNKFSMNILLILGLFFYLMMMNLFGLFPYIFVLTSQMSVNLSLSMMIWLGLMIYMMGNFLKEFLIHLVPLNTPIMLMNFMVLIELVSNLIRPLTLAIRMTANLISGHLLMVLIGNFMVNNLYLVVFVLLLQNLLVILEISMAFIQSYVFSILMTLYFSELKNDNT